MKLPRQSTRRCWRRAAKALLTLLPAAALIAVATSSAAAGRVGGYEVKLPPAAKAGDLTPFQPCSYKNLPSRGDAALCATYVAAENPKKPKGRLIALPLVKLPALKSANPGAIFWLTGGPGLTNFNYRSDTPGLFENYDIYMLGYRGVDDSDTLLCPEFEKAAGAPRVTSDEAAPLIAEAARRCAERITASGIDLSQNSMVNVIGDHEGLRKALGLSQVNLMSVSYGTRLAQYYSRLNPKSVRRSIQIAVNPPGHFRWYPEATNELLGEYAKLCAADVKCSARTPDLRKSVFQTLAREDVSHDGKPVDMDKARLIAFNMLMNKSSAATLFDAVLAAEKGDNGALARLTATFSANYLVWGDMFSKGSGEMRVKDDRAYREERRSTPTSFGSATDLVYHAVGKGWPMQPFPKGFDKAVVDRTPTLLINGDLDNATPLKFVKTELLPYLPNGRLVILKNQSHQDWAREQQPAMDRLFSDYLKDGTVDDSGFVTLPVPFK